VGDHKKLFLEKKKIPYTDFSSFLDKSAI